MKIINYIMMIFIVCSSLYSIDNGYYIYKFGIDGNDSISLYNSKFIDAKLKVDGLAILCCLFGKVKKCALNEQCFSDY